MAKNVMTSKECREYRRRYVMRQRLQVIVFVLFVTFIMLSIFYGGMLYERYG